MSEAHLTLTTRRERIDRSRRVIHVAIFAYELIRMRKAVAINSKLLAHASTIPRQSTRLRITARSWVIRAGIIVFCIPADRWSHWCISRVNLTLDAYCSVLCSGLESKETFTRPFFPG
jgi:hypothetical protein